MELKVWVDGVQRVVCGLAERTTCQEVIYALAHATQRTGRFVLVEKWRKSERSLSPHDRPLELLSKWGEYAGDVQFVLKCLEDTTTPAPVQQQRPGSAIGQRSKVNGSRRMNNSLDENGKLMPVGGIPNGGITIEGIGMVRNGGGQSMDHGGIGGRNGGSTLEANNQERTMSLSTTGGGGVLKPYFVDTSCPMPESGTLIRPSSSALFQQQPTCYEAAQPPSTTRENFIVRRSCTPSSSSLSPNSPPPPPVQHQYFISGPLVQRSTNSNSNSVNMLATNNVRPPLPSLTVLSHSTHESLTSNNIVSSSLDSSGATLYLDGSYASSTMAQQQKQIDLSQTSFCSSSISSNTSLGSTAAAKMNGQPRPPPPSYDTYVSKRRDQLLMANRSGQQSPLPMFGQGNNATSRCRTPQVPMEHTRQSQGLNMTREQLIRLIESQHVQIQAQCQTMRAYDSEIAHRENPDRQSQQPTPIMEHLRRELQQLEVGRVHVKQKVEELRRQSLDSQLATLRQTLTETLVESGKLDDKLKSMDSQMNFNEEKIRSLSKELERERSDIFGLSSAENLNDSFLASNEAFEARVRTLDEMLASRRKELECGSGSPGKIRSRSFDSSLQSKAPTSVHELTNQQRPIENVNGVWV